MVGEHSMAKFATRQAFLDLSFNYAGCAAKEIAFGVKAVEKAHERTGGRGNGGWCVGGLRLRAECERDLRLGAGLRECEGNQNIVDYRRRFLKPPGAPSKFVGSFSQIKSCRARKDDQSTLSVTS